MKINNKRKIKVKSKKIVNSFKYAIQGIFESFRTEKNMKIHILIMLLVIIIGVILKISSLEWIICVFCFAIVIGAEMFNTAIEKTVDIAMPQKNPQAKIAKDISAGAVLIFAIGSVIIGLIVFVPKIIS